MVSFKSLMHHHQLLILNTKQAKPSTLLLFASLTHLPKPQLLSKPPSLSNSLPLPLMGQFPTRLLVVATTSLLLECHMSLPLEDQGLGLSFSTMHVATTRSLLWSLIRVTIQSLVILMRTTLESNLAALFPSRLRIHQKLMFLFTILL